MRTEQRTVTAAMGAGLALIAGATLNRAAPLLVWNATASAPTGLYLVAPFAAAAPGEYVLVRPQPTLAAWLAHRGYLPPGVPLVKRLAAVAGQEVCRFGARIVIDGRFAARARYRDRQGRPLPEWVGCRRLGRGEVFLLNIPADSLDGRYFGVTSNSAVIGPARPLVSF